MTRTTPEQRADLARMLDAATPGPWRADGDAWIEAGSYDEVLTPAPVECMAYCYGGASRVNLADGDRALIVAAVNALPDLLADLEDADALTVALRLAQARATDAETEARLLAAKVGRVRELHRESRGSMSALYPNSICECGKDYPCPTIRALDGEADR